MKRALVTAVFACFFLNAFCQNDYFLLPEDFFPHKGETLNLHLLNGSSIVKAREQKFEAKSNIKFSTIEGSKVIDLTPNAKEGGVPVLTYEFKNSGVFLIEASQHYTDDVTKREFANYLTDNDLDKVAQDLKQFTRIYKIKSFNSMKTLVEVDKHSGDVYSKPFKEELEITLKENPYRMNYGDDVTAVVTFDGKPMKATQVNLIIRTASGAEFPQRISTNENGEAFFKVNREGTYMLKVLSVTPEKNTDVADYDIWESTFTFAFSSSNTMPNSYKEFGFGNRH